MTDQAGSEDVDVKLGDGVVNGEEIPSNRVSVMTHVDAHLINQEKRTMQVELMIILIYTSYVG